MTSARLSLSLWAPVHTVLWLTDGLWAPASGQRYADFAAWCAAHPGRRCTLWVGGSRVTDLVCEAAAPLAAPAVRLAWARRVWVHYRGPAASLWPLLPWRQAKAWGACALEGLALDELRQQAREHQVKLLAVRPLWPVLLARLMAARPGLHRADRAQAWLLEAGAASDLDGQSAETAQTARTANTAQTAQLTCLSLSRGRLVALHRRRLRAPWQHHLQALIDGDPTLPNPPALLLCVGASAGQDLRSGVSQTLLPPYRDLVPRSASRGPDFLAPMPRAGLLAWAWLATTVLVLGLAGWNARLAWQAGPAASSLALPAAPRVAATKTVAPVDQAQQLRLAHPWQQVFKASEVPLGAGLNWLSLEHQVDGDLRLHGVAVDAAAVQRVAAGLRAQPVWRQVLVSRLEVQPVGLSFEIVARMARALP